MPVVVQGDGTDSDHDECEQEADLVELIVCFKSSDRGRHLGLEQTRKPSHQVENGHAHQ